MKVKVLGLRYAKGTSKSGRPYEGYYTSISYTQKGYEGEKAEEKFLPCELLMGIKLKPGDVVDLDIDLSGYIQGIDFVK